MIWVAVVIGLWLGVAMIAFVMAAVAGGRREDRRRCQLVYGLASETTLLDVETVTF